MFGAFIIFKKHEKYRESARRVQGQLRQKTTLEEGISNENLPQPEHPAADRDALRSKDVKFGNQPDLADRNSALKFGAQLSRL